MNLLRRTGLCGLAAIICLAIAAAAPATAAQPDPGGPSAAPFVVLATITIKPGQVQRFVAAMDAQAVASRNEAGVVDFRVFQSDADPLLFYSVESYRDKAAFEAHVKTPGTAKIMAVLKEVQARDLEAQFLHPMPQKEK